MNSSKPKLTLYQPAAYQIKVPGVLNARWVDEASSLRVEVEEGADGQPVTALTGLMDQAALLGLLRRLNGMGLPLILVMCVDFVENRITSEG